jgi:hypothetical protein
MTGLSDDEVRNCTFNLLCSQSWAGLRRIDGESRVRFCGECQQLVHLCTTPAQVRQHARERHCVALRRRSGLQPLMGDVMWVGRPNQE